MFTFMAQTQTQTSMAMCHDVAVVVVVVIRWVQSVFGHIAAPYADVPYVRVSIAMCASVRCACGIFVRRAC